MIKEAMKKEYKKILPGYEEQLLKELRNVRSILDVGCGKSSPLKLITENVYKVGIDIFKPALLKSKTSKIHDKYYCANVMQIDKYFQPKQFDCVVALDLIEHLDKNGGLELIRKMEKIAKKKVIIFTPNWFISQGAHSFVAQDGYVNKYQEHKSGWTVNEFKKLGYFVSGMNGLINLRTLKSQIKFKPRLLWLMISDLTQLFVRNKPQYAYQLFCVKKLE